MDQDQYALIGTHGRFANSRLRRLQGVHHASNAGIYDNRKNNINNNNNGHVESAKSFCSVGVQCSTDGWEPAGTKPSGDTEIEVIPCHASTMSKSSISSMSIGSASTAALSFGSTYGTPHIPWISEYNASFRPFLSGDNVNGNAYVESATRNYNDNCRMVKVLKKKIRGLDDNGIRPGYELQYKNQDHLRDYEPSTTSRITVQRKNMTLRGSRDAGSRNTDNIRHTTTSQHAFHDNAAPNRGRSTSRHYNNDLH